MFTGRERGGDDELAKRIKREDAPDRMRSTTTTTQHLVGCQGSLNTLTPCAACKLLRRRCALECPFSPYFSPHDPQKFASVHKVYGASNVSKMLMEVPESQRADAANSLVYEANVRLRDPVYGCMGAISALQQQVQVLEAELNILRAEITKHRFRPTNGGNNVIATTSHVHVGGVSVAALPPIHTRITPPEQASSSSSIYTPPPPSNSTTTIPYSSITNDNVINVLYLG